MHLDHNTQAMLLLSSYFNNTESKDYEPLTAKEYGRFAQGLKQAGLQPSALLSDTDAFFAIWQDPAKKPTITQARITQLLSRGRSMAVALEKWHRAGIWVLTRADPDYPQTIKRKLKHDSPAILFGTGNHALLNQAGVGFVGSRKMEIEDQRFTENLAQKVASQGLTVISGAAKGIDETAMLAALNSGGESVGIVADNLLTNALKGHYRPYLANGKLVLISTFYPEAGFNVGHAMGRNKYIYSLANAVVTVKSDFKKGGTWNGTRENLNKGYCQSLIRNDGSEASLALIEQGGISIDDTFSDFLSITTATTEQNELFSTEPAAKVEVTDPLQGYGSLLRLFYQELKHYLQQHDDISINALATHYPELDKQMQQQWLKILLHNNLLIPAAKADCYTLPNGHH